MTRLTTPDHDHQERFENDTEFSVGEKGDAFDSVPRRESAAMDVMISALRAAVESSAQRGGVSHINGMENDSAPTPVQAGALGEPHTLRGLDWLE